MGMSSSVQGLPQSFPAPAVNGPRPLKRVLYVISLDPSKKFGSLEEQILVQACAFRDRQSVFVPLFSAAPDEGCRENYKANGLEVTFLDLERFRPGALRRLLRLLRQHRVEVVHWNMCAPTNLYYLALRVLAPAVKHFFTDHNSRTAPTPAPSGFPKKQLKRFLLGGYARVIGVSQFVVDALRKQETWPPASCLMHFINTDRFAPDEAVRAEVRRLYDVRDQFVLVTVAHLIKAKGVDVAVRAMQHVTDRARLWVVGEGEEFANLKQLCQDLGLEERVRFLGLQAHVPLFLQAADAFVCPSLWAEAAGLVNLEAQATALPVLASRVGGIPEYIQDGETGWLFEPGDEMKLAELINRMADDPASCARMGRQARLRAEERFSVAARLEEYLDLYR
jgi:glycosyltransferase involved in cell wall biosynthesis